MLVSPHYFGRPQKVLYILQTLAFRPEATETGSQLELQVSEQPTTQGATVVMRKDAKDTVSLEGNNDKC